MSTSEQRDVSYELGGINKQLEAITRTLSENRSADAQYRTGVRAEMKAQSDQLSAVSSDLTMAKRDISEMKPKVDSLNDRATMTRGAQNLAIMLGKFAYALSAAIGGLVVFFFQRWFGRS